MAIQTNLTIKQQNFCHEYLKSGNATKAYLTAYDSKSEVSARQEANKLLRRDDITEYIQALTKPSKNEVVNERTKKRNIIWDRIQYCIDNNDDSSVARYMDILNKMDQEYINITRTEDNKTDISNIDTAMLEQLATGKTTTTTN